MSEEKKPVGADAHIGPRAEAVEASGIRHQASGDDSKAFPLGGRCPSAHTGADEGTSRQAEVSDKPAAAPDATSSVTTAPCHLPLKGKAGDGGNGLPRPSGPRNDKNGKKPEKGRGWVTRFFYPIIYVLLWTFLRLYHWPTYRGKENLPEGACVICGNHSGFADPVWVFQLLGPKLLPWTMARKSLFEKSAFARNFLLTFRAFPVDRDNPDMAAIKKALSVLKGGEKLLIFPEGTRIKKGKKSEPKSGAVLLAQRADVPLVPVYITHGRKPFQPIKIIMGEAYKPAFPTRRPSNEELEQATTELMAKVYALGNA